MTGTTPIDTIIQGDCLEEMKKMPDRSIDAIVTDPPYELTSGNSKKGFMGKAWDGTGIAYNVDMWGECLRVLKPGGHLLAFGGTRTYHRMACAIEDAGFEIRDSIHWVYGSGFPKSLDISKALDKAAGAEREVIGTHRRDCGSKSDHAFERCREIEYDITAPTTEAAKQWAGWGSALKPAHEPVVLARKPLDGCTIAENVLRWGCGGLNIDACRIGTEERTYSGSGAQPNKLNNHSKGDTGIGLMDGSGKDLKFTVNGRFPSNLIHDASPEVLAEFAKAGERTTGDRSGHRNQPKTKNSYGVFALRNEAPSKGDTGSAARFFMACEFTPADYAPIVYYAKASRAEREEGLDGMPASDKRSQYGDGLNSATKIRTEKQSIDGVDRGIIHNGHPTVKPLALMRYLCKLITPPGGLILDPFGGSGTTGMAAIKEGFHYILIEKEPEYCEIARKRIAAVRGEAKK
jgi:DNA modification methylase